jgi:hypothetical protein
VTAAATRDLLSLLGSPDPARSATADCGELAHRATINDLGVDATAGR